MADELGAELSLDLDAARREVESLRRDIEDELERAVTTFGDEFERAVNNLPEIQPDINAAAITDELNGAVRAADADLAVTPDVDALQAEISAALGGLNPEITANTDPMVAQIEGLFDSFHPELTPELDTTALQRSLGDLEGAAAGLDIGAGFDDAALQGQELADVLGDLETEGEGASDGLGSVSNVSTTLATAFSAARGDGRRLISDLAQIRGGFGGVAAGALALGAGFTALFEAGERSLASTERATVVLGDAADRIETIDVGGLTGSLSDLAIQAGVSGGKLRDAATSAAQIGLSSGASAGEVTEFANKVNALALRAVALQPALGDAGAVAQRLNTVLARGGRFLARYGIDLTSAEITTRALADSGKTAVRDLTLFERSVAGADIAVEKLGTNLGKDFARGTETATVRIASIRAELNSAFARAGKPLVEPTITAFEALAEAGAGVSTALGSLGEAVLPSVSLGLETLGETAGVAVDALNLVPGEFLAIGAAALIFRNNIAGFITNLGTATRAAPSLIDAIGGGAELQATGSRVGNVIGTVTRSLDTLAGRSALALGATIALDQGLNALGTSTEELGIQFITTGAAIGFAVGGIQGALVGAGIGAIAQVVTATTSLDRATQQVDESIQKAATSSGNLQEALFATADTTVGLANALYNLDINLARFVNNASSFKALGVADDLRKLGLSAADVGRLAQQGEEGLARFIARAQDANEISFNVAKALASELGPGTGDVAVKHLRDTREELQLLAATDETAALAVIQLRKSLDNLGVGAKLTGVEFAGLSAAQQKNVLVALRQHGENTDLLVAFQALQKQIRETQRNQFDLFATTNKLSPAIVNQAKAVARAEDGTVDWAKALKLLGDAAAGVLPELGRLTADTFRLQGEFSRVTTAIDAAAQSIPSLGSALSKALGTSFFEESIIGPNFLDTERLTADIATTSQEIREFFDDVRLIADTGASNTAAALLALGPENLGARVAADLAANAPLFREGLEKAFEGIAQAQLFGESLINEMRARINFLAGALGTTLEERLKAEFGVIDISTLTTPQLIAFVQKYGTEGSAAATALVDAFNREIVTRRLAGLDTTALEGSVQQVKDRITGVANTVPTDIESALLQGQAKINAAAQAAVSPIPLAIESLTPEVIAGLDQIGAAVTTGTTDTRTKYKTEFERIVGITRDTMGSAAKAAEAGGDTIGDSAARAVGNAVAGLQDLVKFLGGVLGGNLAAGIATGIYGRQSTIEEAMRDAVNGAYDAGNIAAGISSPAKKFMPMGQYMVEGAAVGAERSTALEDAIAAKINSAIGLGDGLSGFGGAPPTPPAGLSPVVRVVLDPLTLGSSIDNSISVGAVHNYGPDIDSRGRGLVGALRDVQFTGGNI